MKRRETYLTVQPDLLQRALAVRTMSAADLAVAAKISPSTVSRLLAGKRVVPASVRAIVAAIERTPALAATKELGIIEAA